MVCVLFVVFCFMLRKIIGNFSSYLYNVNSYLHAASLLLSLSLSLSVILSHSPFLYLSLSVFLSCLVGNCHYAAKCCASSCGFLASIVPTSKSTSTATATSPGPRRTFPACVCVRMCVCCVPCALVICNLCNYFS